MLDFRRSLWTGTKRGLYSLGVTQGIYRLIARTNIYSLMYLLRPLSLTLKDVDWRKTRAYSFGYGQIYLNTNGTQNQTGRDAAAEARDEDVRKSVIKALLELVDKETGAKPVVSASRREELFSGPHTKEAPDIRLSMADGYEAFPWASIADRLFAPNTSRSGTHTKEGIVLMKGEGIKQGNVEGAAVTDIAPTILYLLGFAVPPEMDGHVLTQAFEERHLRSNPLKVSDEDKAKATGKDGKKEYALSDDEEEVLEKNLRSLGYI